jgi:hypothetical protein
MAVNSRICWPRLWQSFWHDENYPIRNAIVGTYKMRPDGSLKLKPVSQPFSSIRNSARAESRV